MSNDAPANLKTSHLLFALAPEQSADDPVELQLHYDRMLAGIAGKLDLADLLNDRIREMPERPEPATLGELIQAARKRLRQDRLQADVDELRARRFVLTKVRGALVP